MQVQQIIKLFYQFFNKLKFEARDGNKIIDFSSDLLFINAGIARLTHLIQFSDKDKYRLYNNQRCIRVGGKHNDIEEIGPSKRHFTFFHMLGIFEFGYVDLKSTFSNILNFLKELQIDLEQITITAHPDNPACIKTWHELGMQRIELTNENVWSGGVVGPQGHCTEIFINGIEILNIVMISEFVSLENNKPIAKSTALNIDIGIGLERLCGILQNQTDLFQIDIFKPYWQILNQYPKIPYETKRIIIDHLRSSSVIIDAGITPSADGRGYILRKITRRLFRKLLAILSFEETLILTKSIVEIIVSELELSVSVEQIYQSLNAEAAALRNCRLQLEMLEKDLNIFDANNFHYLYDTFGIHYDLIVDLAAERGLQIPANFETKKEDIKSLKSSKFERFIRNKLTVFAKILNIKKFDDENIAIEFDHHPFFPGGGGQEQDEGVCLIKVENQIFTLKLIKIDGLFCIFKNICNLLDKLNLVEPVVELKTDRIVRKRNQVHHSAHHILLLILQRQFPHQNIIQRGSSVSRDKFHIDIDAVDINPVELTAEINNYILEHGHKKVQTLETSFTTLKDQEFIFDKNKMYPNMVQCVTIGDSKELCCGTHVDRICEIGTVYVESVKKVGSGTIRITAYAGLAILELIKKDNEKQIENDFNIDQLGSVLFLEINGVLKINNIQKSLSKLFRKSQHKFICVFYIKENIYILISKNINLTINQPQQYSGDDYAIYIGSRSFVNSLKDKCLHT